jgi:hypothetical protein
MNTNSNISGAVHFSLRRQVVHWKQAASRLSALDHLASGNAWHGIERNLGILLRKTLQKSIDEVVVHANNLFRELEKSQDELSLRSIQRDVISLRNQYLKAEETINFYTVAINSRTTANVAALLRACDILCMKSMQEILQPMGKAVPQVMTYVDKGIGASILKTGLRLWDGNISPVAAIKVTHHNLFRPTAIIHETGHQVAHILDWNDELANALREKLKNHPDVVGTASSNWASEIAADAFAFVHTGYAAVSALHDVVSGTPAAIFTFHANDPHPISYLRVLLGIEMCRLFYGAGPWDQLESAFKSDYDIRLVNYPSVGLINLCLEALPEMAQIILKSPYRAFNNQSLSDIIQPIKVSPRELQKLEYMAGPSLFTSHAWIWKECIRLLALLGYKIGTGEGDLDSWYKQQEDWMIQLGYAVELN